MKILQVTVAVLCVAVLNGKNARKPAEQSTIDTYIAEAEARRSANLATAAPGSVFSTNGVLTNAARDLRASQLDDIVTILVADRATALSKGGTNSSRKSSAKYGIDSLYGPLKAPWTNLAGTSGDRQLQGQGETSRENNLSTTVAATVKHVLPNGNMVVEGKKSVTVNSENQIVRIRGIVRPADVSPGNIVRSERLSDLEIEINGRGVVGDVVKRPFILYRILMGLLPF